MNKQDNPHAKGLSVNEDWIRDEDFTVTDEQGKISIDVDLTHSRLKLGNMERNIQEQIEYWKRMRCTVVPKVSMNRASEVFPSLLKETVSFYFGQIPHLCTVIPIIETDRSGLALTNPEESVTLRNFLAIAAAGSVFRCKEHISPKLKEML